MFVEFVANPIPKVIALSTPKYSDKTSSNSLCILSVPFNINIK